MTIEDTLTLNSSCTSYWDVDDFTTCVRHKYLESVPIIFTVCSILIITITVIRSVVVSKKRIQLPILENEPLLSNSNSNNSYSATEVWDSNVSKVQGKELTVAQQHFDISQVTPTKANGEPLGTMKLFYRGFHEKLLVALEELLLIAQVGISLSSILIPELNKEWSHHKYYYVPYVNLTFWLYLLIVVSVRLAYVSKYLPDAAPNLWYHSTALYMINWFLSIFLVRSAILNHAKTNAGKWYYIGQFIINTLLVLISGTEECSDKPVIIYEEDGVISSREVRSSMFSQVTYAWVDGMVFKAWKQSLRIEDVWGLRHDDYAYPVLMRFNQTQSKYRFTFKLFGQFTKYLFTQGCFTTVDACLVFVPSILLKKILEYIDNPDSNPSSLAWLFVFIMLFSSTLSSIFSGGSLFVGRRVCTRMKAILVGEVYAKALRRRVNSSEDNTKKKETAKDDKVSPADFTEESKADPVNSKDLGTIINLMAVDAFKVSEICGYLHYFINSFVMATVAIYLLNNLLGWPALVGALSILILMPLNYHISMKLGEYQKLMLAITDKRIQKLNETFQNIRIIKFFAWEDKFAQSILDVREEELSYLKSRCIAWVIASFVWFITPTIVSLVAFYFYAVVQGKPLTTPIAFTALSLFNLLRTPLDLFADMLSYVIQSKVSLDRIEEFLLEPECTKYEQLAAERSPNSPLVGFENATFSWSKNSSKEFKLRDINIDFKIGKLNVILGPTGSGKSSLLLALLGEMDEVSGKVFLPGITPKDSLIPNPVTGLTESVAYCSQSAWLLNDTIKENIVFSSAFNAERYKAVIEACGLKRDLDILDSGDQTQVGEKGITLSGGQKQRVSLARALYSSASYVLLDDCLSAVDSHTAVHIYEKCITGPLMNGRTCILVSHNVALTVKDAELVIIMENGRVKSQGSVEDLMQENALDDEAVKSVMQSRAASTLNLAALATGNEVEFSHEEHNNIEAEEQEEIERLKKEKGKLVEEETKSDGSVKAEVYIAYFKYFGSRTLWFMIIMSFFATQAVNVFQSYWLRVWSMAEERRNSADFLVTMVDAASSMTLMDFSVVRSFNSVNWNKPIFQTRFSINADGSSVESTIYYISVYAFIGVLYALAGSARIILTFFGGLQVSRTMFKELLDRVLRSNLRFFDSTPVGRIMNRFSKDVEGVDQELAPSAEGFAVTVVSCAATIIVICSITPAFLVFGIIIALLYAIVGALYINLSRELKRFDSITRSPIHQHFTETLVGVTTIRAYGDELRFLRQNMEKIDDNNKPFFYVWLNNRWLAFRADIIGSFISFFAAAFAVAYAKKIDSGMAGMSLSFAVTFNQNALWLVRLYSQLEINMNSVERLQEYITDVVQEPPAELPESDPPKSWPDHGAIEVENLSLRYAPTLPRVIDSISFSVKAGEKIGVVGRTGAGKSTIITSFFRFVDPETGSIKIDGVDITKIGLKTLRQGLTIIPQDPTLFTGTIRSNLDPFDQFSDLAMFESLKRVNLISPEHYQAIVDNNGEYIESLEQSESDENENKFLQLNNAISEGGGNLSQGERQLLCLARSLLKSPKVLMLDEATASIDYEADAKIQKTIREEFSQSTILTIAHRLKTIIDYDKILVLDAGKVKQYDHPYKLIVDKETQFSQMCQDTGEFDELVRLAKEAFVKSQ
ncbi:hypothetical protein CANARDRAFT_194758 [[Candida] arabinofermentans NRRL YB-2248]|uniref:Uncharacterized protein n=1 Tax=[Candida] arabinofermentans NRRL YB-2248 TaxID=983967 RepID=A0A1E4T651_9ASCO|nr:hypothetical protein CANARDRAFT_194758 [[Candida] arabinofermentans NRRL YB-2248]